MGSLNKLLGITAVGATIVKARLVQRFINDLAGIITLAIATGMVTGAFLIGALYVAYQVLLHYGLDPFVGQILIGSVAGLLALILIRMTSLRMKRLRGIPGQIINADFPLVSRINGLADSFLDGLMNPSSEPKK